MCEDRKQTLWVDMVTEALRQGRPVASAINVAEEAINAYEKRFECLIEERAISPTSATRTG